MTTDPIWKGRLSRGADGIRHVDYARYCAERFDGRLRFSPHMGWLQWNGNAWTIGHKQAPAMDGITTVSDDMLKEAGETGNEWLAEAAMNLRRTHHRRHIAGELEALPELHVAADELDAYPHLLTFANGIVNLYTGEIRDAYPECLLTKAAPTNYRPDAQCPQWEQFLADVFPDQPEVIDYMQTLLGYAITGENREHAFAVWFGNKGRNGKGTIIRALKKVFGPDLVKDVDFSVFERGGAAHTEDIARMRTARIVTASEGSEGTPMNDELLKRHAGGDSIQARHLYRETFEYVPKYLIVLLSNYLPQFQSQGAAIWSRVRAVEFTQSFEGREDRTLDDRLAAEAEGIAAWCVRGAMRYYAEGLKSPEAVSETTRKHKEAVNPLSPLIDDLFVYDADARVPRAAFNSALKEWKDANGIARNRFTPQFTKLRLGEAGVQEVKIEGCWYLTGIRLTPEYGGTPAVPDSPASLDVGRSIFGNG
ncbi:phage/plasmid primase, P4 family [Streptomyces sp. NPDC090442]|uniref:DNA primase family protein n=1 Tax=Streptomyces sp. NPDC090442 TaxID=3365962 RepID=UPI003827BD86